MRRHLPWLRPSARQAVDWEIRHHLEETVDRLVDEGWAPDEARREAERRFGPLSDARAAMLAEGLDDDGRRWIVDSLANLLQDVRLAFRGLRKRPVFTWTLVATLALGIGATGAIFSVLDAVMLRPLPYAEPDRLVDVGLFIDERNFTVPSLQADQVHEWTQRADFFSAVALHEPFSLVRTDGPEPETLNVRAVTPSLDDVLGISMARGRAFAPEDGLPGARVVILTHGYWQEQGADPDIVGREIRLDGEPWTVVGVLPRGVKYPVAGTSQAWIPLADDHTAAGRPQSQMSVVGRLAEGVSLESAQERADVLAAALDESLPHQIGWGTKLDSVGNWRGNPDTRRGLWTAGAAVLAMFLIALLNGANLQLVRAQERLDEAGVRKAMGASRGRLLRQAMVESVVLAMVGALVATGLAWAAVEAVRVIAPTEVTFSMVHDFGLEGRSMAVIFGAALAAGLLVGLPPALQLAGAGTTGTARTTRRDQDRRAHRLRSGLVALEVALSVVLLVGAGLFLRSFTALMRVDTGMEPDRVAVVGVSLPSTRYPSGAERAAYVAEVVERLGSVPGVARVAASQGAPPQGGGISFNLEIDVDGAEPRPTDELVLYNIAQPGYFEALGTRFIDGRPLQAGDHATDGVVVDRDMARLVFGEERVAGRRFRLGTDDDDEWMTVVGVVEDLKFSGPDDQYGTAALVYPMNPESPPSYVTFVVRTEGDPRQLLPGMRAALLEVDRGLPLRMLHTGREALAEALVRPRFLVSLMAVLGGVALALAAVGLFGVISYSVSRRRRDMGIRIALGASRGTVRGGVLRWGVGVGLVGTALGLFAASLVDDLAASLLFGVAPGDVATSVGVALTMLGVALAACWVPAVRATRVDPLEVLRQE